MRALPLLLLAACGSRPSDNTMLTRPSGLADIAAPPEVVFAANASGLYRVRLSDADSQLVSTDPDAKPLPGGGLLHVEDKHYVIERGKARIVVDGVEAKNYGMSPDRKWIAILGDSAGGEHAAYDLVVISTADGTVRKFPLVWNGIGNAPYVGTRWAPASDAVFYKDDSWHRLDIVSGAVTPADKVDVAALDDISALLDRSSQPLACPAKGIQIEQRWQRHEQRIVLVPIAAAADPEHLSAVDERVLVVATDRPGPSGDGAINLGKKRPEPLSVELLTKSCSHYLFELEGTLYVGNIETGRYARLFHGVLRGAAD
ncbi:MAG: hypothetical protein HOV81_43505 [Kofleriaceae bacterium]|nr:hypothetical protein [Kofleriaceae bacterium]